MNDLSKFSRREFVTLAAAGLSLACPKGLFALAEAGNPRPPISADQALRELLDGNGRFVKGQPASPRRSPQDFRGLAEAQYPEAVIVCCADSRVAPEILFDVGVGDIFVIRVAGNVVG